MRKKSNDQFIEELKVKRPNVLALEQYEGKDTPILVKCNLCGREWKTTPRILLSPSNGTGCRKCSDSIKGLSKRSKEKIQNELDTKKIPIKIVGDYKGVRVKTESECLVCGYHWFPRPDKLLQGFGCPQCGGAKKRQLKNLVFNYQKLMNMLSR